MSDNDLITRIEAALEKIRPYLKADGGNVEFYSVTPDNVLKVKLTGACEGCPFSMFTMKAGVEQTVLKDVPEIKEVVTV